MIDVVLPVLDEAEALPWVLDQMPAGYRAIVADNGSTDGSADIARRLGAVVVVEPRPGFGAACYAGLLAASASIVCFMDCDGSLDPGELPRVTSELVSGRLDLALGARVHQAGAWPAHARVANRLIAFQLRRRLRVAVTDLGPMRAAYREPLLALGVADRRFGWPLEMVARAAKDGWRVGEVPVSYLPRRGGRSKVSGSWRGSARAVLDMSRVAM